MINPAYDEPGEDGSTSATSSSATDSTSDSSEASSASPASSESDSGDTTLPASCGNGVVEGIETCDDGNDVDGDGCNVDCVVSGTQLWEWRWDGGRDGWDVVHDIALLEDGSVVTGGVTHTDAGVQAEQVRISAEGVEMLWQHRHSVEGASDTGAWGAARFLSGSVLAGTGDNQVLFVHALDADGNLVLETGFPGRVYDATSDGEEVWVVGQLGDETSALFRLSSELELIATYDEPSGSMPVGAMVWAVAQAGDRVVVAGEAGAPRRGFVRELYEDSGSVLWEHDVAELGGDHDAAYGAAIVLGGAVATVGDVSIGSERNGWLMRRDTGGRLLDEIEQEDLGNYHGVAIGPSGEIAVAGWVDQGLSKAALIVKYGVDGSLAWRQETTGDLVVGDHKAWSVAIRDDSVIVVGGTLVQEETSFDAWVAAYRP